MDKDEEGKIRELDELDEVLNKDVSTNEKYRHKLVWPNIIYFGIFHLCALWGVYHLLFRAKLLTAFWWFFIGFWSGEAVALGAHRYYSHKAFKATIPLQVVTIALHTVAGQNSMFTWARDHRVHHKYSDTDADPHNANRGFFFSHIGWLLTKKHPLVLEKTKCVDVSDLQSDKLVMFQHRHYFPLYILLGVILPICLPVYAWGETFSTAFFVPYCLRYVIILHLTWFINSLAHLYGKKPYDSRIVSVESKLVSGLTGGEGWHNYHHSFPWDYRAGEFSLRDNLNTRVLHKLRDYGFVYDMKTASDNVVIGHRNRHGDGTHGEIVEEFMQRNAANKNVRKQDFAAKDTKLT